MNKYQALVDMIEHGNSKGALDALEKLRDEDREIPKSVEEVMTEFTELFVRNPAEIEGMKRVEWRQLADDKVEQAQHWLRTALTQTEERVRREERERCKKLIPKEKPMSVYSFVLKGEELEDYMKRKGYNQGVSEAWEALTTPDL